MTHAYHPTLMIAPAPVASESLTALRRWMSQFDSALIAYSGGVDSALVMSVAGEVLSQRALACIGVSPSYPQRELKAAIDVAQQHGVRFRLLETQEHLDPRYAANPDNRCYFCKTALYDRLRVVAEETGAAVILDGTNASDLTGHRPGHAAAKEHAVRSPLAELGLTKETVRQIAKEMGLSVWDKPASPCLASRIPTGVAVVPELLARIEQAEDALVQLGFRDFRVRHHGDVARIELPVEQLSTAIEQRNVIVKAVRKVGYRFVALDLGGLSSGSLNVL